MRGEFDLAGVFVPGLLGAAAIAYLLNGVLRRGLSRIDFYRFVWHPPLFDVALYMMVLGAVVLAGRAAGWP
jgi:hypothetical protein